MAAILGKTGVNNSKLKTQNSKLLLAAVLVLWIAVVFAGSVFKYENFGQGYDQVDFEQAIWNTVQGRPMEDSRFSFTDSIFGMDWMPMLFAFVPFYALVPSAHTLFFLQIVGAALGVVPIYWLARDRLGSGLAGVFAALAYLLYPTLLYGVMNPFQVRLFSVTLLLFTFYFFEKANWQLFALTAFAAMLARTDVALVGAMFGLYGLLTRRTWMWVALPLVGGLAYFAVSTFVLVPAFIHPDALRGPTGQTPEYMACWPCGHNPVLAYYGHLGSNFGEIVGRIVTHPIETAQLMFTPEKIEYLLSLLLPLGFLPLLSPRPLILCLPIVALNLLSERSSQYSYQTHYSLLLLPGLFAAAIYGADNLGRWVERLLAKNPKSKIQNPKLLIVGSLAVWVALMNVPYKNPIVRALRYPEPPERVQAARELIGLVPPEAKVASSSFLGAYLLPRLYIYNFPPAPYSPYNFGVERHSDRFVDLDYILVDPNASALDKNPIEDQTALERLRGMPEWELVKEAEGYMLYKRRQ